MTYSVSYPVCAGRDDAEISRHASAIDPVAFSRFSAGRRTLGEVGKERAVVAGLLGIVLLLFELVLIARMVVDWIGVLSPVGGRSGLHQARRITHGITEPVIGPVRRVLKPVRFGSVSIDLAFTAVFVAVIVLRTVLVPLIPF
jgi:YggT family protein